VKLTMTENTGVKTVLIVDDEKSFLLSLRDGLKRHEDNFRVLTAENGKEAISLLRALPVDLLITDLKMPHLDGFELLAWTTREKTGLPVIVMTAFGTAEIEAQLAEIDSLQYLEKPLALSDLETAIFSALKAKARSYIRGITLATFIQLMHIEKKSCTLKISRGEDLGYLFLWAGELYDAKYGTQSGEAAAYEILSWEETEIEMDSHCRHQERIITSSLEYLLIDAYRLRDEKQKPNQIHGQPASIPSESVGLQGASDISPAEAVTTEKSPAALARMKLVNVLERHQGIQEFALFDASGFIENRNEGRCELNDFDPEIFVMQVENLAATLSFGSFNHIIITTSNRRHCLLFRIREHRVVARLLKGQRPAEVMKQVSQYLHD